MVAISNGKEEHWLAGGVIALGKAVRICQIGQKLRHIHLKLRRQQIAGDMSAPLHQVEIVDLLHPVRLVSQVLNQPPVRIVHQHHNVRQLNAASRRTATRGGIRERTVPSVARIRVPAPGV